MEGIPTIPARSWNECRDEVERNRPLPGLDVFTHWTSEGVILTSPEGDDFNHPWKLSFAWREDSEGKGKWTATVRPGFVNCHDVTIHETREGAEVDVPLIDETPPALVFSSFRNPAAASGAGVNLAGQFTQTAGEGYPPFFESLGVRPTAKSGLIGAEAEDADGRTCQIRACDVVLITPRIATRQTITVTDPRATGQTVEIGTEFLNTELRNAPAHRLITTAKHSGPPEPTLLERLEGTVVEPQTDEIKLSTVYFVSPPDTDEDAEPDGNWTPYAAYFVFWNLAHASVAQFPEAPPKPLSLPVPLAGGVAQPIINSFLSLANDAASAIAAYVGASDFRGIYWAPSGLGFATLKRPEPRSSASADDSRLDPKERRQKREAAKAAAAADVPALNPPFPFLKTPFDPFAFGLDRDPE